MTIIISFIIAMLGMLAGLTGMSFIGAQSNAGDTLARTEINSIHGSLELFYADNGYYPSAEQIENLPDDDLSALLYSTDVANFYDANDKRINAGDSVYSMKSYGCTTSENGTPQCSSYKISGLLSDGVVYTKNSLN